MEINIDLSAIKAVHGTSARRGHPNVIHVVVDQLRAPEIPVKGIVTYIETKGYIIRPTQINGMVFRETGKASHMKKSSQFKARLEADDTSAWEELSTYLDVQKS